MWLETLGKWLATCALLGLQAAFLYVFGRFLTLGGGLVLNPFQPGWSTLAGRYSTSQCPPRMASASARVGFVTYKNLLSLAYGPGELFLKKEWGGMSCLHIPYHDLRVVQPPRRHTILRIPLRTDGLFEAAGVRLALPTAEARALIEELAYAERVAPTSPNATGFR